jgi:Fur family ferric uptake transcriptional regulator
MLHMNAETALKERRLRATPARVATLDVLLNAGRALTHHEVDEALAAGGERLDRVTLYRTLDFLVAEDLAHRLSGEDRSWRFSAHPANSGHAHPHFCCEACGDTLCLGGMNPAMVVGLPEGYVFRQAELTIRGLCPSCNAKAAA